MCNVKQVALTTVNRYPQPLIVTFQFLPTSEICQNLEIKMCPALGSFVSSRISSELYDHWFSFEHIAMR